MDIATFLQNVTEQKKRIAIGSAAVIGGVALLIAYFQSGPTPMTYAQAEDSFIKWEASPQDENLYQEMRKAMRSVPILGKKYEAAIAQKLLNTDRLSDALKIAAHSLDRVKDETPFHANYARNSLLIEQGNYQQALENAVTLKENMGAFAKHIGPGSLLYAHNLLRIACLQQELKNRHGERAALEELETFISANKQMSELVIESFSENLIQYIAERKRVL